MISRVDSKGQKIIVPENYEEQIALELHPLNKSNRTPTIMTLDQIAIKHGTDKASHTHGYVKYYERYFEPIREEPIILFEASWGGYEYPDRGGQGAKTWREYFPNATIVSIDRYPKINIPEGIYFHQGSQDDIMFWHELVHLYGNPDIIIDDASHISSLCVKMLKASLPLLKPGGYYVVEDLHASYWREIASDGTDFEGGLRREGTTIEFLKGLIDELMSESGVPNFYDIESMYFFDKLTFIKKNGNN